MASDDHLAPLGRVAVLSARMEQLAVLILGLLLDLEDARVGDIMCGALGVAQVLERTKLLAPLRLQDTQPIDAWLAAARSAVDERNRLMHSAWSPTFDHATQTEAYARQRLLRSGDWDVDKDVSVSVIERVAASLMEANAAGTNAYIVTERRLLGRS
jgi:hypothetical protein